MIKFVIVSAFVAYASAGLSYSSGGIGEGLSLGGISLGHIGELGGGLGGGLGGISIGHSLGGGLGGGISLGHIGGLGGGLGISGGGGHYKDIDYHTVPHYEYKYAVHDPKHHDVHEQQEKRIGDKVVGEYSLHEPDGTIRIVKYEADKHNGFNAIVERKGHAIHPIHYKTYEH